MLIWLVVFEENEMPLMETTFVVGSIAFIFTVALKFLSLLGFMPDDPTSYERLVACLSALAVTGVISFALHLAFMHLLDAASRRNSRNTVEGK